MVKKLYADHTVKHLAARENKLEDAWEAWIQFPLTCVWRYCSAECSASLSIVPWGLKTGYPEVEKHKSEYSDSPNSTQEHEAETNLLMLNSISLVS